MASSQLSAAPSAPAHPLANPGYGKRSAPEQLPRRESDFGHLPRREASIAAYIDRLPDGSDMSVKMLAKILPDYGQCAVRTALRFLSEAGHLRLGRETVIDTRTGSNRWVTRTFFSRTARDDAWWTAFQQQGRGDSKATPDTPATPIPPAPQPSRPRPEHRSLAYEALASLGRTKPQMSLSAADCVALESVASEWLRRGATVDELRCALTAGLPAEVHHPASIARTRLAKLPPERAPQPVSPVRGPAPALRILECTECRVPGRPEALSGGLCRVCRDEPPIPPRDGLTEADVRAHAARVRAATTRPPERNHA